MVKEETKRFICPKCEEYKDSLEYYPFAEEYMCEECYNEMMNIGKLVEEEMEGVIKYDRQRGLPRENEE